jgi:hypothetical protein
MKRLNQIQWNWRDTVINWDREKIFEDLLQECYVDSIIFLMAKAEVYGIIDKSSFRFVIADGKFDDFYPLAVEDTQMQIKKFKNGKKSFLHSVNCTFTNQQILQKIISRIANNLRNLFDRRYKKSVPWEQQINVRYEYFESIYTIDCNPLDILLIEEEILNNYIVSIDKNFIQNLIIDTQREKNQWEQPL